MKIIYTKEALKEVKKIKDISIKDRLLSTLVKIKQAKTFGENNAVKKLPGHPAAFRIRIGDYHLGLYCQNNVVLFARFLKRQDIKKVFP